MSPLHSQLIERAMEYGNDYPLNGSELRLQGLRVELRDQHLGPCFSKRGRTSGTYESIDRQTS